MLAGWLAALTCPTCAESHSILILYSQLWCENWSASHWYPLQSISKWLVWFWSIVNWRLTPNQFIEILWFQFIDSFSIFDSSRLEYSIDSDRKNLEFALNLFNLQSDFFLLIKMHTKSTHQIRPIPCHWLIRHLILFFSTGMNQCLKYFSRWLCYDLI